MRQTPIVNTSELAPGTIVLSGSTFYWVTDASFPAKFRGYVWEHSASTWGAVRDVPLPSPAQSAYVVTERRLFPSPAH